jgi:hypothetical protein
MLNGIVALHGTGVPPVTNSYESIATVALSGSQSSIQFSSIPSTFKHLQLRLFLKDDRALNRDSVKLTFNGDSGLNYTEHAMFGDGSSASAQAGAPTNQISMYRASGNSSATNIFGAIIADVLDYQNTSKNKTLRYLGGVDFNGSGEVWFGSGSWMNTSAVSSITIAPANASNFLQYSHAALYGIKG